MVWPRRCRLHWRPMRIWVMSTSFAAAGATSLNCSGLTVRACYCYQNGSRGSVSCGRRRHRVACRRRPRSFRCCSKASTGACPRAPGSPRWWCKNSYSSEVSLPLTGTHLAILGRVITAHPYDAETLKYLLVRSQADLLEARMSMEKLKLQIL